MTTERDALRPDPTKQSTCEPEQSTRADHAINILPGTPTSGR
jgi:hypothetical protein